MNKPKLIIIYGFAGIGKTTLAKKLNLDIPFSLYIEADNLLNTIGQWILDETKAREYVFSLTKSMVQSHLKNGCDVIIPMLLTDENQPIELETIAKNSGAQFIELYLKSNKTDAIEYMYQRGTWGESDKKLTENDRQHIENIYDSMENAMISRKNCIVVPYVRGDIDQTYQSIIKFTTQSP